MRLVVLAECGTHAVSAAATGACTVAETVLADTLLPHLKPGMLLADRGFPGYDRWKAAAATGADLLWRVTSDVVLVVREQYADGSYLSEIYAARDKRRVHGQLVRVVEYTIAGHEEAGPVRLITTLLDPDQAPAAELAALYHERWEVDRVLDEIKVHQRGPDVVLRSRHPDGVEQEVYGSSSSTTPCARSCTRPQPGPGPTPTGCPSPAPCASCAARSPPRRLFPPERLAAAWDRTLAEILRRLSPVRRLRAFPRVVKRKMSNWGLKRAHHRNWPQPAAPSADTVTIVPASKTAPTKRKPKATA